MCSVAFGGPDEHMFVACFTSSAINEYFPNGTFISSRPVNYQGMMSGLVVASQGTVAFLSIMGSSDGNLICYLFTSGTLTCLDGLVHIPPDTSDIYGYYGGIAIQRDRISFITGQNISHIVTLSAVEDPTRLIVTT